MQLITILLVAVSIIALLSGVAVLVGSTKGSRLQPFAFFLTTVGVFGWSLSMAIFLPLGQDNFELAQFSIYGIYLSTLLMDLFFLIYVGHKIKWAKLPIIFASLASLFFAIALVYNPNLLYEEIVLSDAGNSPVIKLDWYYFSFAAFTMLEGCTVAALVFYRLKHTSNKLMKRGWTLFLITLSGAWLTAGVFDLILPPFRYDLIWIGPLFISVDFVVHYYSILKYRLLDLASSWLKALSYIIIISLTAIIYLTVFYIVFMALFRGSLPSTPVIALTSIMILVVLLLFPALTEISNYVRSLAAVHEIDMVYLVKKLVALSKSYINYFELSDFLAEHLHFQYIGILYSGKLYGSGNRNTKLSAEELKKIEKLKNKDKDIWLPFDDALKTELKSLGVEAIAELRNARSEVVGHILLGRPLGGINLNSRDLSELETALTLTAAAISK